jgi:hypothetical protein
VYNAWAKYHPAALPTTADLAACIAAGKNPAVAACGGPRLTSAAAAQREEAITWAAYNVLNYLIPEAVARAGLLTKYTATWGFSQTSVAASVARNATDPLLASLGTDGFNQASCYADVGATYVPDTPLVDMTNSSTINAALAATVAGNFSVYRWAPIKKLPKLVKPQKFLVPQAGSAVPFS